MQCDQSCALAYAPQTPSLADQDQIVAGLTAQFDHLTGLATQMLGAPVALVSFAHGARDRAINCDPDGLRGRCAGLQRKPLSRSFCQHVVADNAPLAISDARLDPWLIDNRGRCGLDVVAYLGVPIHCPSGEAIGALCTIDTQPHAWSTRDVAAMSKLATCASDEIRLQVALLASRHLRDDLAREHSRLRLYTAQVESMVSTVIAPDLSSDERFRALLRSGCRTMGTELGSINRVDGANRTVVFAQGPDGDAREGNCQGLEQSPCVRVVRGQNVVALPDLTGGANVPMIDGAGLPIGSYIGAPIQYQGMLYGTLCFSAAAPRPAPWSEDQVTLMSLMALAISSQLAIHAEVIGRREKEFWVR